MIHLVLDCVNQLTQIAGLVVKVVVRRFVIGLATSKVVINLHLKVFYRFQLSVLLAKLLQTTT